MPSGPRILIVEDEHDIADFFAEHFERRGYDVARAYCGLTGLALAKVTRPDIVLLNYMMPGMNGLAVLRELRSSPKTAALKVIMISGYSGIVELASAEGAQEAVLYPARLSELDGKVERILRS